MKMLMLVYSGESPSRVSSLLDASHAGGWTEFTGAHGAGASGRREGNRAWPGESTLFVSVVPDDIASDLVDAVRSETSRLGAGERLHVAVLPTETFI